MRFQIVAVLLTSLASFLALDSWVLAQAGHGASFVQQSPADRAAFFHRGSGR